mgnify:CR=1 FL=1
MAVLFAAGEPVDAKRLSQTLEHDEDEIHAACKALMDELSYTRSGIRIDYAEPAAAVPIDGDKNRLRQVFANVFDNAIKYSGEGKKITVRIEAGVSTASVVVTDEGIGIPPEDLPKITTRFYKAGNATTGSGIGLSVVSEIMNLHGGALEFQSELGKGTTVRLRFPLAGRKE